MRFDIDTTATPEQARQAFTDFTGRRARIWSKTLDPQRYELRELGDTWAVARESTPRSPFWVVARYDWSDPAEIRWTVEESSYGGGGTGLVRVTPADGGGSHVHAEWTATGGKLLLRPLLFLVHHGPMPRLIARMWADTLDGCATVAE